MCVWAVDPVFELDAAGNQRERHAGRSVLSSLIASHFLFLDKSPPSLLSFDFKESPPGKETDTLKGLHPGEIASSWLMIAESLGSRRHCCYPLFHTSQWEKANTREFQLRKTHITARRDNERPFRKWYTWHSMHVNKKNCKWWVTKVFLLRS